MKTTKDKIEKIVFDYTNTSMIDIKAIKDEIFDLIIEEKTKDNWVSVNEKLPEYNEPVIIYHEIDDRRIIEEGWLRNHTYSQFMGGKTIIKWESFSDNHVNKLEVTHWRPLLKTPKGIVPNKEKYNFYK